MNATLSNLYRLAFRIGVGGQLHIAGAGAYLLGSTWLRCLAIVLLGAPLFFPTSPTLVVGLRFCPVAICPFKPMCCFCKAHVLNCLEVAGVVLLLLPSSDLTCVVSSLCIEKCALCYWEWSGMVTWLVLVLGMPVELAEVLGKVV